MQVKHKKNVRTISGKEFNLKQMTSNTLHENLTVIGTGFALLHKDSGQLYFICVKLLMPKIKNK